MSANNLRMPKPLNLKGNVAEEWRKFRQNFEIFLLAGNCVKKAEEVKVAILLNCIGEEAVELFNTFNLSEEEQNKLSDVLKAFEEYAIPRRNTVIERFNFNCRTKDPMERFDEFLTDLKKLVKTCEYGTLAESLIRDRIVLGINDQQLQERLLREVELTLEKAIEICRAAEISKLQTETITPKTSIEYLSRQKEKTGARADERTTRLPVYKHSVKTKQNYHRPWKAETKSESDELYICKKCNLKHKRGKCFAWGKICNKCKTYNHFAICCNKYSKKVNECTEEDILVESVFVYNANTEWMQKIQVGGKLVQFKLDTGAQKNILPTNVLNLINCNIKLKPTNIILEAFGGSRIKPLGLVSLECKLKSSTVKNLEFVVVNSAKFNCKPLLGLSSCIELGLINRHEINCAEITNKESFIEKNKDLFEGLGTFEVPCSIKTNENVQPIARPPRRVPDSIKPKLKDKLVALEKEGIISKVENPDGWINNLVIVEKPDGSIRVCLDPQDLNKVLKQEYHLIPTVEELLPKLNNKSVYSVFDLKDGFYQIKLDKESSKLCQFSSPFGCFKFERLPFGISVAPQLFQKFNEKNFGDIPGVLIYFDDLLIYADNERQHDEIVKKVVERARELNIKFNQNKLQYRVNEVKYLGFVFSKFGMKPDPEQVKAVLNLHEPCNKKELQRILGMINYLRKFIPKMSEITAPLRELLKTNVTFEWLPVHTKALNELKDKVSKAPVLGTFDSSKPITLQCDSSKSGLGCCLLQENRPVSFASRALSEAEINYAQVEKEYLSIVFATKKFHNFIYGRRVTVHTDHKPLVSIHNKNVVNVLSSRLQRMKLKLLKYDLDFKYVPGKNMYVADLLSRSYINETDSDDQFLKEIVHCVKATRHLHVTDRKLKEFQECTLKDPVLSILVSLCKNGWPDKKNDVPELVRFYFKLRQDLFEEDNILFLNGKIVVPVNLRKEMLCRIHEGHFGMEKCKSRARQIFYWPNMSQDIENLIAKCSVCEKFQPKNCKEPLISHEILSLPFEKVGCDICEFGRKDFLVVMDYLTKWLEIVPIDNKQSNELIDKLKCIFSTHGVPKILVADNMPFSSYEFKKFSKEWDFDIVNSSPRYPRSNGQAEAGVKIAKTILKKCFESDQDYHTALMEYRSTPIKGLEFSPAQALMSRRVRTKIPINRNLLIPELQTNLKDKIVNKQEMNKSYYDKTAKVMGEFSENQNCLIRNGKRWERGKIIKKDKNPRSYWVRNENNKIIRRNRFDLRMSNNDPKFKGNDLNDSVKGKIYKQSTNAGTRVPQINCRPYVTRFGRTIRRPVKLGLE